MTVKLLNRLALGHPNRLFQSAGAPDAQNSTRRFSLTEGARQWTCRSSGKIESSVSPFSREPSHSKRWREEQRSIHQPYVRISRSVWSAALPSVAVRTRNAPTFCKAQRRLLSAHSTRWREGQRSCCYPGARFQGGSRSRCRHWSGRWPGTESPDSAGGGGCPRLAEVLTLSVPSLRSFLLINFRERMRAIELDVW